MKRLLSTLLCLALLATIMLTGVSAATSGGYRLAERTDSFTLSANAAFTNTVTFKQKFLIEQLQAMLSKAGGLTSKPKNATEIARIKTMVGDTPRTYVLLKSGSKYYLERGSRCRSIAYADFDAFLRNAVECRVDSDTGLTFYKYDQYPPRAASTVDGKQYGWLSGGDYQFRRLDGSFDYIGMEVDSEVIYIQTQSTSAPLPTFDEQPESVRYELYDGDNKLWSGSAAQLKNYKLSKEIIYEIRAVAKYDHAYYRGNVAYSLWIDRSPRIQFSVRGDDTFLGEAVVLEVTGTTAKDPLATFTSDISLNLPPSFHRRADGSQVAFFPVSYRNTAGNHWIEIKCGDQKARFTINAKDKKWQIQNLTVSSSTAAETIESKKANDEYERVIAPLRSVEDDVQRWSGRFILPVSDQKVTTQFGMIRYVNGKPTSTRHGALDLAVPRGTAVKCTGGGRVLYAGYLQLTGNTILVEHGFGLKSWYYHMDSLKVKTDALVEQGQVIGTVGSTGFSTGPHLHFGMSVNNVFINPYTAINTDLFV